MFLEIACLVALLALVSFKISGSVWGKEFSLQWEPTGFPLVGKVADFLKGLKGPKKAEETSTPPATEAQ